jgi:glycosyltransferase involved in cell wall biosynthesis
MNSSLKYHIILSRAFDLETISLNAQAGKSPCHVMWKASQTLGATIYQPGTDSIIPLDKLSSRIMGSPEHWALARKLSAQLTENDVVFCTGEDIGIPIAALCGKKQNRPKIVMFIHNINRFRGRLALKLFQVADKVDLFLTYTPDLAEFLRDYLYLSENHISLFIEQPTDVCFFTPGSVSPHKNRPLIAGAGLEKRDYSTLADASKDLDVDVKICATSPNAKVSSRAFPKVLPDNMECRFYEWQDLVQLYRDADIVAIPLFENKYQAGLSTLFEALACRRPVIITRSSGIIEELIEAGAVTGVSPGDVTQMRHAIVTLLDNPLKAEMQAQRGYELVIERYNHNLYIDKFVRQIRCL